jgi:hypothetical protein
LTRVQKTLRWFEEDIPLLNMRVKDLSAERQRSARQFAALLDQPDPRRTRAVARKEQPEACSESGDFPCEPAD